MSRLDDAFAAANNSISEQHLISSLIAGILSAVIAPFLTLANAIVITTIWKDPYKQLRASPSNIIIASMAACDFLVGVGCSSIQCYYNLTKWTTKRLSVTNAFISSIFGFLVIGVSLSHVVTLTVDRLLAVKNPLLYKIRVTKSRVLKAVVFIWIFFVAFTSLHFLISPGVLHLFSMSALVLYIVLVKVSCILSLLVVYLVRKQGKELKANCNLNVNMRSVTERDRKTTKTILVIIFFLLACCSPALIGGVILGACNRSCGEYTKDILDSMYSFCIVLLHINSFINPFLYVFRLPKFKKPTQLVIKSLVTCKNIEQCKDNANVCDESSTSKGKRNEILEHGSQDTRL